MPLPDTPSFADGTALPVTVNLDTLQTLSYALAGQFATAHPNTPGSPPLVGSTSTTSDGVVTRFTFAMQAGNDFFAVSEVAAGPGGQGQALVLELTMHEAGASSSVPLLDFRLQETPQAAEFDFLEVSPAAGVVQFTLHS